MVSSFINPRQILSEHLELKKNMLAADFGCGSGEWVVALARMLENGKVYAIDLLEAPLSAVRSKARVNNLQNIEIVKSDIEKTISRLLANSLDLVLMSNLLFQSNDKKAIFREAGRVLKTGGKILAIDWDKDSRIGPGQKTSVPDIKQAALETGFSLMEEFKSGSFHFGLIFIKK